MSLNRRQMNPLSVLGCRKLNYIPLHFKTLVVGNYVNITLLDNWINFNLNGRYALITTLALDDSNKTVEVIKIGVEEPAELTMLSIGCPHLHKQKGTF